MNREISKKLEHVLNRTLQSAKPVKNLGETVVQSSFMEQNQMKLDMILQQRRDGGMVISQHVCEHRNYRVCFVENHRCRNCGWKTPDLLNMANWIIFWLRWELLVLKPVATSKEEFLENQNTVNELMEIENSAVVLPPENFYRSCRRFGDNQW